MVRGHTKTPARVCAVAIAVQYLLRSGDGKWYYRFSANTTTFSRIWYLSTKEVRTDRTRHCWTGCGGRYGESCMPTMLGSCPDRQQG